MKYLIIFVFIIHSFIAISCAVKVNELTSVINHYNISLDLSPENHLIKVKGKIDYISPEPYCDSAIFFLHRQFNIKSISGKAVAGYKFYTTPDSSLLTNPDARILHIRFNRFLDKGEITEITFEYSGEISQIHKLSQNIISKNWTEIGSGIPWFPYNKRHGEFTFDLKVNCGSNYEVRSRGNYSKIDSQYIFMTKSPSNNITVFASKKIKEINSPNKDYNLNLYYTDISDSTAKDLNKDLNWIMKELGNRFGTHDEKEMTVVQSMRDIGGSYSDLGMVSLSQLYDSTYNENQIKYFMQLSHSAARLWWWQAAHDWNDWLNEGFAEFSALLLLKEKYGDNIFSQIKTEKEDSLLGIPPVWMFNREHVYNKYEYQTSHRIMNDKAPIFLFELYKRIGSENFYVLCKEMIKNDVSSTTIFLNLLEKREGKETCDWFANKLKTE